MTTVVVPAPAAVNYKRSLFSKIAAIAPEIPAAELGAARAAGLVARLADPLAAELQLGEVAAEIGRAHV